MTQKCVGEWTVDREAGTVTAGDIGVTIVPQGDGTFLLRYSGDIAPEEQIRIAGEVMQAFERASCTTLPLANTL